MKRIFVFLSLMLTGVGLTMAQVPRTISYQGFYTDASGNPVNGAPHKVTFRFFDAVTNVENTNLAREIENITINKGIISVTIGGGDPSHTSGPDNSALPLDVWSQAYKIQVFVDGTSIGDQVPLTTVPYAFVAGAVDGANITGTVASSKVSGTIPGTQIGTGINASNITTGTLNPSLFADGSISGTKIAAGVNASNIALGTLADARLEDTVDVVSVNTSGNITAMRGIHIGATSDPGVNNLIVEGTLNAGASKFTVDVNGNITKLNSLTYSFPSSYTASPTFLANNGSGTLTWSSTLSLANGGTGATSAASARANLNAAAAGTNADITSLTGITTPLSVAQGGTGSAALSGVVIGNGALTLTGITGTANQYLRRNAANNAYEFGNFSLTNSDISGTAAIADTKLATISTAGKVSGSSVTSGTIGGTTALNVSGNIVTSGYGAMSNGLHIGSTTAPAAGNVEVDGYIKMGSAIPAGTNATYASVPAIRTLKLTGTTGGVEGFDVGITHGLTLSKIISVTVMIDHDPSAAEIFIPPGYRVISESEYGWFLTSSDLRIIGTISNSGNLLSKKIVVTILYEQ